LGSWEVVRSVMPAKRSEPLRARWLMFSTNSSALQWKYKLGWATRCCTISSCGLGAAQKASWRYFYARHRGRCRRRYQPGKPKCYFVCM
jgi:hypothetical protein